MIVFAVHLNELRLEMAADLAEDGAKCVICQMNEGLYILLMRLDSSLDLVIGSLGRLSLASC